VLMRGVRNPQPAHLIREHLDGLVEHELGELASVTHESQLTPNGTSRPLFSTVLTPAKQPRLVAPKLCIRWVAGGIVELVTVTTNTAKAAGRQPSLAMPARTRMRQVQVEPFLTLAAIVIVSLWATTPGLTKSLPYSSEVDEPSFVNPA